MTTKTKTHPAAELESESIGFSTEQARVLNPSTKEPSKHKLMDWVRHWAVYSVIPLWMLSGTSYGFGGLLAFGLLICFLGQLWHNLLAGSKPWVREFVSASGFFVLISAVLAILIPVEILTGVATIMALFGFQEVYEQKNEG